jgi:hypothetical protein
VLVAEIGLNGETKIIEVMAKRNLKNINHWIAELRELAINAKLFNYDEDTKEQFPMSKAEVYGIFNKRDYSEYFSNGDTPKEAFDLTMDEWRDAINESCRV